MRAQGHPLAAVPADDKCHLGNGKHAITIRIAPERHLHVVGRRRIQFQFKRQVPVIRTADGKGRIGRDLGVQTVPGGERSQPHRPTGIGNHGKRQVRRKNQNAHQILLFVLNNRRILPSEPLNNL